MTPAPLNGYLVFHLNLMFSSIEEEQRCEVIRRCYWPLLDLARSRGVPLGIEATGYTLEEIEARDPAWIAALRTLIGQGRAEFIGSGYAQIIGPLVPARVVAENLRLGGAVYERLLGAHPTLALVNEQAYSGGLIEHYRAAGYDALLMDWDNAAKDHPEWPSAWRYAPQRARGADGGSIGLLWTNTIAFQKLQRLAHGDIETAEYAAWVAAQRGAEPRALALYGNDAECFDFRPGRFGTEDPLHAESEWARIADGLAALQGVAALVLPSAVLTRGATPPPLTLETAANPIPVKKQPKYNVTRWAVTGRDDLEINAACSRIAAALTAADAGDEAWRELCYLWSSDFRTHITERRWTAFRARLSAMEARWPRPAGPQTPRALARTPLVTRDGRWIDVAGERLHVRLDTRRGLALDRVSFDGGPPLLGGVRHGRFDDIALSPDWYTGDCVFEGPGEAKVTDLERVTPFMSVQNGRVVVSAEIATRLGPILKTLTIDADAPSIEFDLTFAWAVWGRGSLRLGHFTLNPDAIDPATLWFSTHNGGARPERFHVDRDVDHGAPVSFLVSARAGLGLTEGWLEMGDAARAFRVEVDRCVAPLLGLVTVRRTPTGAFAQVQLSALEMDETRRPDPAAQAPRRFRFALRPAAATADA